MDDFEIIDDRGWLDDPQFAAFCLEVRAVIEANPNGMWLAHILHKVGNSKQLCDAIDSLLALGVIKASLTLPVRYSPTTTRMVKRGEWNGGDHVRI